MLSHSSLIHLAEAALFIQIVEHTQKLNVLGTSLRQTLYKLSYSVENYENRAQKHHRVSNYIVRRATAVCARLGVLHSNVVLGETNKNSWRNYAHQPKHITCLSGPIVLSTTEQHSGIKLYIYTHILVLALPSKPKVRNGIFHRFLIQSLQQFTTYSHYAFTALILVSCVTVVHRGFHLFHHMFRFLAFSNQFTNTHELYCCCGPSHHYENRECLSIQAHSQLGRGSVGVQRERSMLQTYQSQLSGSTCDINCSENKNKLGCWGNIRKYAMREATQWFIALIHVAICSATPFPRMETAFAYLCGIHYGVWRVCKHGGYMHICFQQLCDCKTCIFRI